VRPSLVRAEAGRLLARMLGARLLRRALRPTSEATCSTLLIMIPSPLPPARWLLISLGLWAGWSAQWEGKARN
jgi:hypothetical protein